MRIVGRRAYLKARWDRDHWPRYQGHGFRKSQPSLRPRKKMDWLDTARHNVKAKAFRQHNRYRYPWGGSVIRAERELAEIAKHFR